MKPEEAQLGRKIKAWIVFFIIALILSGITAFPIESQLSVVMKPVTIGAGSTYFNSGSIRYFA